MQQQREDGVLVAVAGASRYGKSKWIKDEQLPDLPRVLVWDPRGEYQGLKGFDVVQTIPDLAARLRDAATSKARISYWPSDSADFPAWCRCAYVWARLWPAAIVAEEIADVTNPGKATKAWGELVRKGLFYGAHIYSIVQRPQECDTTTWGNATVIHSHGFFRADDQEYMARALGLPVEEFAQLQPGQWCERWAGEQAIRRGSVF